VYLEIDLPQHLREVTVQSIRRSISEDVLEKRWSNYMEIESECGLHDLLWPRVVQDLGLKEGHSGKYEGSKAKQGPIPIPRVSPKGEEKRKRRTPRA
jgi:hypothetical protein